MIIKYCLPKIIALQKIRKVKDASKIQLIYTLRACKKTSKEKQEKLIKSQRKTVCGSEAVQCPGLLIDRYFFRIQTLAVGRLAAGALQLLIQNCC